MHDGKMLLQLARAQDGHHGVFLACRMSIGEGSVNLVPAEGKHTTLNSHDAGAIYCDGSEKSYIRQCVQRRDRFINLMQAVRLAWWRCG